MKRKQTSKIGKIFLFAAVFALFFSALPKALFAEVAGSVDELNARKDSKTRTLLEIRAKINALQREINVQSSKIASLKNEIALYDLQIQQTQKQIEAYNAEIEVVNIDLVSTMNDINTTKRDIAEKTSLLADLIKEINAQDRTSPLEIVLMNGNFSDILNGFENTLSFQSKNQELLDELDGLKKVLDAKKSTLDQKNDELSKLKAQSQLSLDNVDTQKRDRQKLLKDTKGQETKYKTLLTQVSDEEAKINREIFDLDLAIRKKLGDKSLPVMSGALSWPMEGVLTQGYGNTGFTKLGYTFHNGIDIAAPANTAIYSAGDGVVYATGTGKTAYGNWAVVKHSITVKDDGVKNIYALYGHMTRIAVSPGQAVLRGDLIGLEGNTGNTTRLLYGPERGYHLHFTVFDEDGFGIKDGAYPEIYGPYRIPYGYTYNPMEFLK